MVAIEEGSGYHLRAPEGRIASKGFKHHIRHPLREPVRFFGAASEILHAIDYCAPQLLVSLEIVGEGFFQFGQRD